MANAKMDSSLEDAVRSHLARIVDRHKVETVQQVKRANTNLTYKRSQNIIFKRTMMEAVFGGFESRIRTTLSTSAYQK